MKLTSERSTTMPGGPVSATGSARSVSSGVVDMSMSPATRTTATRSSRKSTSTPNRRTTTTCLPPPVPPRAIHRRRAPPRPGRAVWHAALWPRAGSAEVDLEPDPRDVPPVDPPAVGEAFDDEEAPAAALTARPPHLLRLEARPAVADLDADELRRQADSQLDLVGVARGRMLDAVRHELRHAQHQVTQQGVRQWRVEIVQRHPRGQRGLRVAAESEPMLGGIARRRLTFLGCRGSCNRDLPIEAVQHAGRPQLAAL